MTYLSLTWLTLRNRLLEESRYPLQFFFNTVFFIGVAYMLALGGIAIQGGGQIEANIAAFFLAFLAGAALGYPLDALGGVHLEEFYLKPLPSIPFILALSLGRAVETIVTLGIYTLVVSLVRGTDLPAALRLILVGLPVFFGMIGIGLMLAGIRLVFHKVGSLPQILWIVLLGISLGAPTDHLMNWGWWSPFASGLVFIRGGALPLLPLLVSSAASLMIGILSFHLGERSMYRRGLIGQE